MAFVYTPSCFIFLFVSSNLASYLPWTPPCTDLIDFIFLSTGPLGHNYVSFLFPHSKRWRLYPLCTYVMFRLHFPPLPVTTDSS